MKNIKPAAIGLYLGIFAYFMDNVFALVLRFLGKPASYVLALILAISTSYFIVDAIFRRWATSRRKRILVAGGVLLVVIVLGTSANLFGIYLTKLELSSLYR